MGDKSLSGASTRAARADAPTEPETPPPRRGGALAGGWTWPAPTRVDRGRGQIRCWSARPGSILPGPPSIGTRAPSAERRGIIPAPGDRTPGAQNERFGFDAPGGANGATRVAHLRAPSG